jgi:hypothetical protein
MLNKLIALTGIDLGGMIAGNIDKAIRQITPTLTSCIIHTEKSIPRADARHIKTTFGFMPVTDIITTIADKIRRQISIRGNKVMTLRLSCNILYLC